MIVFPNAKINIGLFVTGKRPDGFHNLETVFYPVGLSDILEIGPGESGSALCHFVNTGIEIGGDPEKNLIVKAWHLLAEDYPLSPVNIHLHKLIPFGAGLGGGSADAAFTLKALNEYFDLHISDGELSRKAACLGSDCAFFIHNKPAFASGKGEILEPLELSLQGYRLVLVKPAFGVSTPEAYAGICPQPASYDLHQLNVLPPEEWKEFVGNDFEKNLFRKYPRLAAIKQELYEAGAFYASMTGSGSAIYGLFRQTEEIRVSMPDCFVWQELLK